ncbi:hypothetical protein MYP14_04775 [Rhodococcus pyridinivorans]|uniref:hypothetical protein n=1 Tax=Rhodococcus pyridinivorans TaxID=103816 RepID=UPI001FFFD65D|nr:hypothetical protein [Rhodococcus pyridinivorans]UPK64680.1 hypothetical protein MYP14_04775 [Rhodococcus pyridinivorans]
MTSIHEPSTCDDAPDHLDPQPIDAHRWRCAVCGVEWTETLNVEIAAEGTRSGVLLRIGNSDFPLDHDTAHLLIDQVQAALRACPRDQD